MKTKVEQYRVKLDGPRPAVGPFSSYKEAMTFARNTITVPTGETGRKEEYLASRIQRSYKRSTESEKAEVLADEPVKKRGVRGPAKRSLLVSPIVFSPINRQKTSSIW